MDVFRQRIMDEHGVDSIMTQPSITYKINMRNSDEELFVNNPADIDDINKVDKWFEPINRATIITPTEYAKHVKKLLMDRRSDYIEEEYMNKGKTVKLVYDIPFAELVTNFFDKMKQVSAGYASLNHDHQEYRETKIQKVVFHLNDHPVDALTFLVNQVHSQSFAREYAIKLKELLPR